MKVIGKLIAVCVLGVSSFAVLAGQYTLIPLAAYTSTQTSATQVRSTESSIHVIISVTAYTSGSITPEIDGIDSLGNVYPILVGTAINSTGTTVLKLGNSIGTIANAASKDFVPDLYQVKVTSSSIVATYSVTLNTGK